MDMDRFTEDQHDASQWGAHLYEDASGTRYFSDRFVKGRRFPLKTVSRSGHATCVEYQGSYPEDAASIKGLVVSHYDPPSETIGRQALTASWRIWSWSLGALGEA